MGDIDEEAVLLGELRADMRESQRQREALFHKMEETSAQMAAMAATMEHMADQLKALGATIATLQAQPAKGGLGTMAGALGIGGAGGLLGPEMWDFLKTLVSRG